MSVHFQSLVNKASHLRQLSGSFGNPPARKVVPGHLLYLDGLRAVAALYVLMHHAVLQVNTKASTSGAVQLLYGIFEHGRYAVDLFIVISGFCLMLPVIQHGGVLKKGALNFFARRAKRILPTYYIALALSLVLIYTVIGEKTGTNWDISIPVTNWDILTHLFLFQDAFADTAFKINHVFWSISVEWHIYFLFPLLVLLSRIAGTVLTTIFSLVLSLAFWMLLARLGLNVYGMAPHYISLFCFGMLAAQISFSHISPLPVIIVVLFTMLTAIIHPIVTSDFIVGILALMLLIAISREKLPWLKAMLSSRHIVFIGSFAYSIYLVHAPLLQIFSKYVTSRLKLPALAEIILFFIVCVPIIVGASYLFFLVAERPFLTRRQKVSAPIQKGLVVPVAVKDESTVKNQVIGNQA